MFELKSKFTPSGDQPKAIEELLNGFKNKNEQVLLGATGTGKTFTVANIIQKLGKKTLILAHNKTLGSQLYAEFKSFFPEANVEYFVSYFDYYQPEAYMPGSDTYIEKDSSVNEEIDRLRHSATASLVQEEDVIIIASVSCIYGLGSPVDYKNLSLSIRLNEVHSQKDIIHKLIDLQYERNDTNFSRSKFRVRGDIIDVVSSKGEKEAYRIEFFDDVIEAIYMFDILTGKKTKTLKHLLLFPASHYATEPDELKKVIEEMKHDLKIEVNKFKKENKLIEAQRLEQRTLYDLEMMQEMGYCNGIENYSRYITKKEIGTPPFTLIDYFGDDWLLVVDESHVTLPQVRGMYEGDRRRKQNLVDYGFRLKAALDNRPLNFEEFVQKHSKVLYISATPNDYEIKRAKNIVVEQIIRPTNLVDPIIEIRPKDLQIDDIIKEINDVLPARVLITTLTKKMAEDLTEYLREHKVNAVYLHSDIGTIERIKIINSLRIGKYDVLIGINLLREGLDLPEVERVLILDADKQGFLRSSTALIQTIGRASRNKNGKVIMYANEKSTAMNIAIEETNRRRKIQVQYNIDNNLKPISIVKDVSGELFDEERLNNIENAKKNKQERQSVIKELKSEMQRASKALNFEKAAEIRDLLFEVEK